MGLIIVRYLPVWLLVAGVLALLITGRPIWGRGALAAKHAGFKTLRLASPLLNGLILTSVIGKPYLEHLQKNGWNPEPMAPQLAMPLTAIFIVSLYAMLGAIIYFFFRAIRNINALSGEKLRSPYSALFMLIPISNLIVIPYLEYFTYQRSWALAAPDQASKLRAALLVGSAFALLVISVACGRVSEDAAPSASSFDPLSWLILGVTTACASGILTTRIINGIFHAQELYAQRISPPGEGQSYPAANKIQNRKVEALKSAAVAVLLIVALATAVFPSLPSRLLEAGSQAWSGRL